MGIKCQVSVERIVLDLKSEGPGSIPTRGNISSKFYNPNLHNIARSDNLGFKTNNPIVKGLINWFLAKISKNSQSVQESNQI